LGSFCVNLVNAIQKFFFYFDDLPNGGYGPTSLRKPQAADAAQAFARGERDKIDNQ